MTTTSRMESEGAVVVVVVVAVVDVVAGVVGKVATGLVVVVAGDVVATRTTEVDSVADVGGNGEIVAVVVFVTSVVVDGVVVVAVVDGFGAGSTIAGVFSKKYSKLSLFFTARSGWVMASLFADSVPYACVSAPARSVNWLRKWMIVPARESVPSRGAEKNASHR